MLAQCEKNRPGGGKGRQKFSFAEDAYQEKSLGKYSDANQRVLGDVNKVSGDPEQVYRICRGLAYVRDLAKFDRLFVAEMHKCRLANDRFLSFQFCMREGAKLRVRLEGRLIIGHPKPAPADPIKVTEQAANKAAMMSTSLKEFESILAAEAPDYSNQNTTPRVEFLPPIEGTPTWRLYLAILAIMDYPNTTIAWIAAMAVLAAIGQRCAFVEENITLAQFLALLSGTGEGKSTVADLLGLVRSLLMEFGEDYLLLAQSIGGDFSHAASCADTLERSPVFTTLVEDGAYLLSSLNADSNQRSASEFMLQVRTKAKLGSWYAGQNYAKGGNRGRDRAPILSPSLTVVIDSQPPTLHPHLNLTTFTTGRGNRWFFADASRDSKGARNLKAALQLPG